MERERYTIEDFNRGVTKTINGLGNIVTVQEVTDRLLTVQGIRFKYSRPCIGQRYDTITFVTCNGRLLDGYDTVLDLFKI